MKTSTMFILASFFLPLAAPADFFAAANPVFRGKCARAAAAAAEEFNRAYYVRIDSSRVTRNSSVYLVEGILALPGTDPSNGSAPLFARVLLNPHTCGSARVLH